MENYVLILCNGREAVIKKGQLIWMSLSGSIFPRCFQNISLGVLGSFLKIFFLISIVMFRETTVGLHPDWSFVDRRSPFCPQLKEVLFGQNLRFYCKQCVQICYSWKLSLWLSCLVHVSTLDTFKAGMQNSLYNRCVLNVALLLAATSVYSSFTSVIY